MQSGSWIQTTGPNNGRQLRDYSKSSNRSENRPLICGKFGTRINLKGEHVSWPKTETNTTSKNTEEENTRLIKIVKGKYLNPTFISNFDSFIVDEWNNFNISSLGNLAFVSYEWDAGDDEGHSGTIEIGYADENMCYWAKDCMINQI